MAIEHVYRLEASREPRRPQIDFEIPKNGRDAPWLEIDGFALGHRKPEKFPAIDLTVKHAKATDWDCYRSGAATPMFSERALNVLSPALTFFSILKMTINGSEYGLLCRSQTLDCLDRKQSQITMFPHDPKRIMEIEKYVFRKTLLSDPLLFMIPESDGELFATDSVKTLVENAGLRGMNFTVLDGEA